MIEETTHFLIVTVWHERGIVSGTKGVTNFGVVGYKGLLVNVRACVCFELTMKNENATRPHGVMASHQLDVLRVPGSIPGVAKFFFLFLFLSQNAHQKQT